MRVPLVTGLTVESRVLQKIRSEFREIKNGVPGRRFVDHYERARCREGASESFWRRWGDVAAGSALLVCGLALSVPPGVPGFLLWVPGLALLATRSMRLAVLLDRLEAWGRRM